MKTIAIIGSILFFSSCSVIIKNQGFKNYKSEEIKTDKYRYANKYQKDLLYLDDLCANCFPDIENVFPSREQVRDSLLMALELPAVTENTFVGYARFYLSHFKNQHTSIGGLKSNILLPYILYPANNSWYVWDINMDYDSLLIGKKILTLAGKPMQNIENSLYKYVFAENAVNQKQAIRLFLNRPDLLKQFGVIKQTDSVSLKTLDGEEIWVKSITRNEDINFILDKNRYKENTITERKNHNYDITLYPSENYAYFQFNRCHDKIDTYETMPSYLRSWIIPFAKMYMNRQIRRKNSDKLQGFIDTERPVFKDYLEHMFDSVNTLGITNLIIDLRNNPGGSNLLCTQLLYYLTEREDIVDFSKYFYVSEGNKQLNKKRYDAFTKAYKQEYNREPEMGKLYPNGFLNCDSLIFEQIENNESAYYIPKHRSVFKGKIIVLANSGTGSAAALFTTTLQDNNIATIIGTSVGNNAIGATNFSPYKLPKTKFKGSVATGYLVRPKPENGMVQMPDYWVENSVEDLISGNDRLFGKALDLINESKIERR